MILQKIFAKSDNSDLLGNSLNFKGKAILWIKMSRINEHGKYYKAIQIESPFSENTTL